MDIDKQIAKIRQQQKIDDLPVEERRVVARRAINQFRKFISPVNHAVGLEAKINRILALCRLSGDEQILAEILAARLAAQFAPAINAEDLGDLVEAAGLSVVESADIGLGVKGKRATILITENSDSATKFCIRYKGQSIIVSGIELTADEAHDDFETACQAIDRHNQRGRGGRRLVEVEYGPLEEKQDHEIFDTVHDPWRPSSVYSQDLKVHPTQIIEPSTLAATPYPPATYRPLLPAEAIDRGFISDAQFEVVTYALQAITTDLPGSPLGRNGPTMKGGFIIGDGTGVGKTNEFCAVIMDQWLRGKKRHIVVVERSKHVAHIVDAWKMIGGEERHIMAQKDRERGEALPNRDGIMVTSYALLRDKDRYNALVEWANAERIMEGVIVFDEAHNMRNAINDLAKENNSWGKNESQQGVAGLELQTDLPRAGVIYASATIATDVYNFGFAIRLGLWGHKAPFEDVNSFINQMHKLDEAALEQICIDLKSAGRYASRTLSFDGVEYEELTHHLTMQQRERFNATVTSGKQISDRLREAMRIAKGEKTVSYSVGVSGFDRGAARHLIEGMLTDFNLSTVIDDMHQMLAMGYSPVVQVNMTGEADLVRRVGDRKHLSLEEYRDQSAETMIERSFPEHMLDAKGQPKLDANGKVIPCPAAVKLKQEALTIAKMIGAEMNPIDRIIAEFGAENVAEMTGRSMRVVPKMAGGRQIGWDVEDRKESEAIADVEDFQQGRKSILVFSLGAGGTGLSYHADKTCKNQRRRVHYLLELGRRAEGAVQGLGRTHRAGQMSAPIAKLVTSSIPAHMIFASRTLAKIAKMGALSRGHQHATSNAIFEQRIPMNSVYAARAWAEVIEDVAAKKMPMTLQQLCEAMSMEAAHIRNFEMALTRLARMTDGDQKVLVDSLIAKTEENIAKAISAGTYNSGLETIRADSIEVIDRNEIVNQNGSKTTYYRLQEHHTIEKVPFRRVTMIYAAQKSRKGTRALFMRHKVSGKVALAVLREGSLGIVDLSTPAGTTTRSQQSMQNEPWKIIDMDEAERLWNQQEQNLDMRQTRHLHILSGSLLYNWDKLPKSGVGLNRCRTDDGNIIVGRVIHNRDLRPTLSAMGMTSTYTPAQLATMLSQVDKGARIEIDNGWEIQKGQPGAAYRLVIPDDEMHGMTISAMRDIGVNAINTPLGYEFEIERASAIETMRRIAVGCTLTVSGIVAQVANDDTDQNAKYQAN